MTDTDIPLWRRKMMQAQEERLAQPRCINCGQPENIVWVHGHGQCAHCKMNVAPCCDGGQCD